MRNDDVPLNAPAARADKQSRRRNRARRFRGQGGLPQIRYPSPPNMDQMSDEEIDDWYQDLLPEVERAKYRAVTAVHSHVLEDREVNDREIRLIMNSFFADPEDPVDVPQLLEELGVPPETLADVDWETVNIDDETDTEELLADLEVI